MSALPCAAVLRVASGALLPLWSLPSRAAAAHAQAVAGATVPRRIVVLDWDLTEIVLSLDVVPVGVSRPRWYTLLDGQPALPPQVADTGLLFQPNFEELQRLAPDLIVVGPAHAPLCPMLERIAPTLTVSVFSAGIDAYQGARQATRQLGATLDRTVQAQALLQRADTLIADQATRIHAAGRQAQALLLLRPIDGHHVTVFGARSLFDGVLRELGVANAWQRSVDRQGFAQTDLAALGAWPDARVVMVGTTPVVAAELARSPLWNALPFVQAGRVQQIKPVPPTGGVVAAMRFATQIGEALGGTSS